MVLEIPMENAKSWTFSGVSYGENPFCIDGVDIWKHKWIDTRENVVVEDPQYHQKHTFDIYEICFFTWRRGDVIIRFAAGEFSNCVWGFYLQS